MTQRIASLLIVAAAVLLLPAVVEACPTCKDQLASDVNSSGLVTGFFWSILFMLATPFLLAGSWIAYVIYQIGQAEALAEDAAPVFIRSVASAPETPISDGPNRG